MRIRVIAGSVLAAAIGAAGFYAYQFAIIGSAYAAHMLCSGVFVSGRTPESILATDLSAADLAPLRVVSTHVDRIAQRVDASVAGLASRHAVYRSELGCVVADAASSSPTHAVSSRRADEGEQGSRGDESRISIDREGLDRAIDEAFGEPDPARMRRTRAIVVLYDGKVMAERYADGFTRETPLIGWSMAKSVINALAGILVREGALALDTPIPVDAWAAADPRHAITLDQLLHMSSGLHFDEDSIDPRGGVLFMLLRAPDAAAYAASARLDATPGTRWQYSSGTTNIIAGAMRRLVGDEGYPRFPRRALFDRIGMSSAVIETDPRGNFIGSSFMYATARDWAKFGQLYANDGIWEGERILPEGWVAYSRTPAPAAPLRQYGAHFWLQLSESYRSSTPLSLPADTFHAVGHEGQFVTIIPSRRVVIVRLGLTRHARAWAQDEFVARVLEALAR